MAWYRESYTFYNLAGSEYKDDGLLEYYAVHFDRYKPKSQEEPVNSISCPKEEGKRFFPQNNDDTCLPNYTVACTHTSIFLIFLYFPEFN
jgi:hypothetical protein